MIFYLGEAKLNLSWRGGRVPTYFNLGMGRCATFFNFGGGVVKLMFQPVTPPCLIFSGIALMNLFSWEAIVELIVYFQLQLLGSMLLLCARESDANRAVPHTWSHLLEETLTKYTLCQKLKSNPQQVMTFP